MLTLLLHSIRSSRISIDISSLRNSQVHQPPPDSPKSKAPSHSNQTKTQHGLNARANPRQSPTLNQAITKNNTSIPPPQNQHPNPNPRPLRLSRRTLPLLRPSKLLVGPNGPLKNPAPNESPPPRIHRLLPSRRHPRTNPEPQIRNPKLPRRRLRRRHLRRVSSPNNPPQPPHPKHRLQPAPQA